MTMRPFENLVPSFPPIIRWRAVAVDIAGRQASLVADSAFPKQTELNVMLRPRPLPPAGRTWRHYAPGGSAAGTPGSSLRGAGGSAPAPHVAFPARGYATRAPAVLGIHVVKVWEMASIRRAKRY